MTRTPRAIPRSMPSRLAALFVVLACGCGGARPPPMAPPPLDDEDGPRPSIAGIVLPPLPLDVAVDDRELEEGWRRASVALSMPTPRPPHGELWEVEAWADDELTSWIHRRAEAVGAAQRALESARMGRLEVSVVASAILGLAYSRFALDLRGIPVPDVFASDPERARAFQDALHGATSPLWQRALDAFGSCASAAAAAPAYSLAPWRAFCDEESRSAAAMLPEDPPSEEPARAD